jgi:hypothetical protein
LIVALQDLLTILDGVRAQDHGKRQRETNKVYVTDGVESLKFELQEFTIRWFFNLDRGFIQPFGFTDPWNSYSIR